MRKEFLRSQVNLIISVAFLSSFTLFMMVVIFNVADMHNPVEDVVGAALAQTGE